MVLYNSVSSSAPATTHSVMGNVNNVAYFVDLSKEPKKNKDIVSKYISAIGAHSCVNINDYPSLSTFEANIVLPTECDLEVVTIEYLSLSDADKKAIDNFINYITSLATLQEV